MGRPHICDCLRFPKGLPFQHERDGELVGCVVTFVDISERRRNEQLLAEQAAALAEVARGATHSGGRCRRLARKTYA